MTDTELRPLGEIVAELSKDLNARRKKILDTMAGYRSELNEINSQLDAIVRQCQKDRSEHNVKTQHGTGTPMNLELPTPKEGKGESI